MCHHQRRPERLRLKKVRITYVLIEENNITKKNMIRINGKKRIQLKMRDFSFFFFEESEKRVMLLTLTGLFIIPDIILE